MTTQAAAAPPTEFVLRKQEGLWRMTAREFKKNKGAVAGACVLLFMVLLALAAPLVAPFDPLQRAVGERLSAPNTTYLLGTDALGRDVLSRVIYGARISLQVGLYAVIAASVVGIPLGLLAGFFGGRLDNLIMRAMDVILAFPGIIFAIWLIAMLGSNLRNVIIAITFFNVPTYARLARGSTLSVREMDYITAERCIGASKVRMILRHVLPNILAPLVVMMTLNISGAIMTGASLSFLGLGVLPPTAEWGSMLADGRGYLRNAWWMAFFPGITITLVVLAANLAGDGLRDALDPQIRGSR